MELQVPAKCGEPCSKGQLLPWNPAHLHVRTPSHRVALGTSVQRGLPSFCQGSEFPGERPEGRGPGADTAKAASRIPGLAIPLDRFLPPQAPHGIPFDRGQPASSPSAPSLTHALGGRWCLNWGKGGSQASKRRARLQVWSGLRALTPHSLL